MINPGSRRSICRREVAGIRRRLRKAYGPRIKAAATREEKDALRQQMQREFDEATRPYLDDIPVGDRCRQCRYVLYGLTEPRCPECGTEFDANLLPELIEPRPGEDTGPSPYALY